jgi:hypothetical protein
MNDRSRLGWWMGSVLASMVVWGWATTAQAHFLFIRINAEAEAGRSAEVFFSEQAEAGDPRFIAKIAHAKLWAQSQPGEFQELTVRAGADRLRAGLPAGQTLSVVGECQYGVVARPGQTAFLLRYYPKAVAGNASLLDRLTPKAEIPFEIQPAFDRDGDEPGKGKSLGGRIRLKALRNGKSIAGAVFTAIDVNLSEETIKAGPDGIAVWEPAAPGHYSIYVRETLKQSGKLLDKAYDEIREFATLALSWPLERLDPDPEAVALYKEAIAQRASWRDFPGFSAECRGTLDGRPFSGSVTVSKDGKVAVRTDDPVAKPWLQEQLESLVVHRLAPPSTGPAPEDRPRLHFADEDDEHPAGRLVAVEGDAMGSSYRIKDRQITVVNRRMGKQQMTITVLDHETNQEGRVLPHSYVVHYWNAGTGKLDRVETFQERSVRVGSWDMPSLRSIQAASDSGLSTRVVRFSKHALQRAD